MANNMEQKIKTMNLIDFDLSFVGEEKYLQAYIDYLFASSDKSLKDNLKAMDLPNSSYHYCKNNGFKNSYFTLEIIAKYFNVELKIDNQISKELEELLSKAFTECFYVEGKTKDIREKLKKYEYLSHNNILSPIYYLIYISVLDLPDQIEKYKEELPHFVIPMMDFIYPSLPFDLQYVYLDMLSQYYQVTDEMDKYPPIIKELEKLDPYVDERVKTMGHYDLIVLNFCVNNIENAYKYTKSCEQLYIKYFNPRRLNYIKKNLTGLAFKCQKYDEVVTSARSNLLFTSREETRPVVYKQTIMLLCSALILTKQYKEAINSTELIYENEFTDYYNQAMLIKMFCYLKLNKKAQLEDVYAQLKVVDDNRAITLADLIHDLISQKRKEMSTFGKRLKPIYVDAFSGYRQICDLLKTEYEQYLKKNNKFIDILDM